MARALAINLHAFNDQIGNIEIHGFYPIYVDDADRVFATPEEDLFGEVYRPFQVNFRGDNSFRIGLRGMILAAIQIAHIHNAFDLSFVMK
jgi:hypothetical protein